MAVKRGERAGRRPAVRASAGMTAGDKPVYGAWYEYGR